MYSVENPYDVVENATYTRKITEQEKEEFSERVVDLHIEIREVEADKKEVMNRYKEQLSSLSGELDQKVDSLHTGEIEEVGNLYLVPDYSRNIMQVLDADGVIIKERELNEDEKQLRIAQ